MLKTAKFVNKASKNSSNSNFLASKRCYSTERVLKPHEKFRNIAICAHVDHGKTTLVDCLLYQAGAFVKNIQGDRVMDSNQLEKERGITILSKWTSVQYGDYIMNIVDTPGHADFGGEVERILSMVDSVCLLVDATEGVMPQTKFVLQKALARGLRPLVVVNKVDRPSARLGQVENEIFELFISLDASEEQLDFPVLYASAKEGWAVTEPGNDKKDMQPLFEAIIKHVPTPKIIEDEPFKMLVSNLEHDKHFGRILTGKIYAGKIKVGDKIKGLSREGGKIEEGKVMKLFSRRGLQQVPVEIAEAGDIIAVSGLTKTGVTDSVVDMSIEAPIPALALDPPIVAINIGVNDSPLCGKEGKLVSAITLRDRLTKEAECNVTLQVAQTPDNDAFEVRGRGELQIGILVEQMRREGFELSISPPRVMYKEIDGEMMEPVEEVIIDIEDEYASVVMERLNNRKGEMIESTSLNNKTRLRYYVSARCLIGYRSEFKNDTHGTGTMNTIFHEYQPFKGKLENVRKGALISTCSGTVTAYALEGLQARAVMFVSPQTPVYEGMIVGENSRDADMEVNPTKAKQLTNVRASGKDDAIKLAPPRQMTLEEAMCYVQADELLEVTPKSIRLRKKLLDGNERKKARRAEGQF